MPDLSTESTASRLDVATSSNAPGTGPELVESPLPTVPVERPVTSPADRPRTDLYVLVAGEITIIPAPVPEPPGKRKRKTAVPLGWSQGRRKYVVEYIASLQGILRLRDWEIRVDFDSQCEEDELATMTPYEDQRRCVMRFGIEFLELPFEEMRQTLVHEMLHCHMFQLHHMTERIIGSLGGDRAVRAGLPAINASVELTTDILADAFAPLLPKFELPAR